MVSPAFTDTLTLSFSWLQLAASPHVPAVLFTYNAMRHQRGVIGVKDKRWREAQGEIEMASPPVAGWLADLCMPHKITWPNNLFSSSFHRLVRHSDRSFSLIVAYGDKMYNKPMTQYELHTLPFACSSGINGGSLTIDLWPSAKSGSASGRFH